VDVRAVVRRCLASDTRRDRSIFPAESGVHGILLINRKNDIEKKRTHNANTLNSAEFENILQWAADNLMTVNINKTKEIVFHRPSARHSTQLNFIKDNCSPKAGLK